MRKRNEQKKSRAEFIVLKIKITRNNNNWRYVWRAVCVAGVFGMFRDFPIFPI